MTQKYEHLIYNNKNTNSPRAFFAGEADSALRNTMNESAGRLQSDNAGMLYCASLTPLTGSLGFNLTHAVVSPAAANDSQGAPEESTDHSRRLALWSLPDSAVVRTAEAALMLTRSVRTLQNWRYRRVGPSYQLGRTVTYKVGDLRDYVDGCTTTARKQSKYG